jgi:surface polysaccharide O-acyltransferase-like enzyme
MTSSPRDQYVNSFLRGLAILAVVIIHTQGSVHGGFWIGSPTWRVFTFTDQLSRMCVPLFVALSGYGFWQKYQGVELKPWEFIKRQAEKLLPMYIAASVIAYGILYYFYYRHASGPLPSLWLQTLTGEADYQMYFVPMIFQLYLLFPWLRLLVQKFRWSSLIVAGLFQGVLYYLYSTHSLPGVINNFLGSDQQEYVWFFTWIFYFILGMHLPDIITWFGSSLKRIWGLTVATTASWIGVSVMAMGHILGGLDPVEALRFTRVEMLVYASLMIVFLFVVSYRTSDRLQSLLRPFTYLGNYSYSIYLFHTMVLRTIFAFI